MSTATAPGIRERQRDLMARRRAAQRDLKISEPENAARKAAALADPFVFFDTYFADTFDEPWTDQRREMVQSIHDALATRTAQAVAAPRGQGKSTITAAVLVYCVCKGLIRYAVMIAGTSELADKLLENFKGHFERNDLLCADFPEICEPIRDVATSPNKAGSQTADGELTYIEWSSSSLVFPTVDGSTASGVVLSAKGITGAIRGLNRYGQRPDLVIIDDPDDEESAASEAQTAKRVRKINASISGLAKMTRGIGRVMLCTIINCGCVAAQYTDRKKNPAWNGKRFALLQTYPEKTDLWETYVDMRREDQYAEDRFARRAHKFYLDNREAMDRGAVLTNPFAFEATQLGDGTQTEVSALQKCYNIIADFGWDVFLSEYQNDPPDLAADEESRLTPFKVRGSHTDYEGRVTGADRRVVPDDSKCLTAFIDVQKRTLWYEVIAWREGRRAHVVDYGHHGDPTLADVIGVAGAVRANLTDLYEHWDAGVYKRKDGDVVPFNLVLVDSSFEPDAVRNLIRSNGWKWRPSRGEPKYLHPKLATAGKVPSRSGDRYYEASDGKMLVVHFDTVWWKHRCHDAFTVFPKEQPEGCVTLFGKFAKDHAEFGEQICAEEWREEFIEGKGTKAEWFELREDNHLLDCHVGNMLAASLCGIPVMQRKERPRITLSQMKGNRRS